jgi:hypothetical protein
LFWSVQWIGISKKRPSCHDSGVHIPLQEGKEAATMKITDSNQQRNPDQISQQLTALVDQLKLDVKTAAKHGNTFDSVERSILTSVLKIGDQAVE